MLGPFEGSFGEFSVIWVLWELPRELLVRKVSQNLAKGAIFGCKVLPMNQLWRFLTVQKGHWGPCGPHWRDSGGVLDAPQRWILQKLTVL